MWISNNYVMYILTGTQYSIDNLVDMAEMSDMKVYLICGVYEDIQ